MAKRSYLDQSQNYIKAKPGMRGMSAGGDAPKDPHGEAYRGDSGGKEAHELMSKYPEAYSWWRRQINPPSYSKKQPWIVAENVPFDEFVRFYDFYMDPAKNPVHETPAGWKQKEWSMKRAEEWLKANPREDPNTISTADATKTSRGKAILVRRGFKIESDEDKALLNAIKEKLGGDTKGMSDDDIINAAIASYSH